MNEKYMYNICISYMYNICIISECVYYIYILCDSSGRTIGICLDTENSAGGWQLGAVGILGATNGYQYGDNVHNFKYNP